MSAEEIHFNEIESLRICCAAEETRRAFSRRVRDNHVNLKSEGGTNGQSRYETRN